MLNTLKTRRARKQDNTGCKPHAGAGVGEEKLKMLDALPNRGARRQDNTGCKH
jgi:hypothetical protein